MLKCSAAACLMVTRVYDDDDAQPASDEGEDAQLAGEEEDRLLALPHAVALVRIRVQVAQPVATVDIVGVAAVVGGLQWPR